MFLFLRSKESKEARLFLRGLKKVHRYKKDILPPKDKEKLEESIARLKEALRSRDRQQMLQAVEQAAGTASRVAPPKPWDSWRENIEVILVAFVVAFGIRAYYLQPFKIPTGSMQPTLNGIIGYPSEENAPNMIQRAGEIALFGRRYIDVVAEETDRIAGLREVNRMMFLTFTEIHFESGRVQRTWALPRTLVEDFGVDLNKEYQAGEIIARGYINTGDHVFVDKMTYHFRRPNLGEVFVFKTTGIRIIEQRADFVAGAEHYIKRVAGLPGDELQIVPPLLLIDGQIPQAPGLLRVMSEENGYDGYSNTSRRGGGFRFLGSPNATYRVPDDGYFALGDNSLNSSDSRDWGAVPEANLVGRGFVVYWPFTSHWGFIR